MSILRIADGFELPLKFVVSTQAILAKKRVGKSYTAGIQAEELLEAGQHIVIIDPTGAHWGLRSSSDGARGGYPIAILGGDHGDVPLEPTAGTEVADAVVGDSFSAILDLSLMEIGESNRFVGEFLRRLYRVNRLPMHVFIDEADAYAPQQAMGEDLRTLGAVNTVVRRGGIKGIGVTLITQRPAVLSKSVLSQVDMLTCLRLHHPADLKQIRDWVGVHGKDATASNMLESLPSLPKGEAWVWNPEIDLFRRVKLRRKRTFDSGATPEPGAETPAPRAVADVDLGKLGAAIRDSMRRAVDNDPKALRDENAKLRRELEQLRSMPQVVSYETELDVLRAAVEQAMGGLAAGLAGSIKETATIATVGEPLPPRPVTMAAPTRKPFSTSSEIVRVRSASGLSPRHLSILAGIRWWESIGVMAPDAIQVAFLTEYSTTSRGFKEPRGELKTAGLIDMPGDGSMRLTEAGRKAAPDVGTPTTGAALRHLVLGKLAPRHRNILGPLIARYPAAIDNDELAAAIGFATTSRGFKEPRGELRTLGLIQYTSGGSRATDLLFPTETRRR